MTEAELLAALRRRFTYSGNGGAGRYALLTHVRTGAGFDQQELDAVALAMWPSEMHAMTGFEVKCSRTDWLREIRPDTRKSERARALCDMFTVVAPLGIVRPGELPEGWGLIVAARDDDGVILRQHPAPALLRPLGAPVSRTFLAALLRAAGAVPGMTTGLKRAVPA